MALRKVLIANRGEIACRVIAACRQLGLLSVAVYSEADGAAPHTRLADQSVPIGPPEAASSYLDIERLIAAARSVDADAIHPGYGFRAESAELAEACRENGITFIGPAADSLRQMGDKRSARQLARDASVATVPGWEGEITDAAGAADKVGFPLLVKAALGGGGKGMQLVDGPDGLAEALESAARIARSAFGDAAVYLERYVATARHVEVQILGDGAGNAIHLFERECSLQRRHQKVIEEAPSPAVDDDLRREICGAAVRLAEQARYGSAGTVEFLLEPNGQYYFLEMNTRIQVEHPVTEMVTGHDLVQAQLRLAMGEPLPRQEEIALSGWSVEARLVAEDPTRGFLPQAGEVVRFELPRYPFVRIDSGYETGSTVSVHYDSLMAKIVAWGRDRAEAWTRLRMTLDGAVVHGVATNLPLLRFLVRDRAVLAGELSTTLLESELLPAFDEQSAAPLPPLVVAAAALYDTLAPPAARTESAASDDGDTAANPFRHLGRFRIGETG